MSNPAPSRPAAGPCRWKQALIDEAKALFAELVRVHDEEIAAALSGNFALDEDVQKRLAELYERKKLTIERLRDHVTAHGC